MGVQQLPSLFQKVYNAKVYQPNIFACYCPLSLRQRTLHVTYDKIPDDFTPPFVQTMLDDGLPEIDLNSGEGIGVTTQTIKQSSATRESSQVAFVYKPAHRPNAHIQHDSWVTKVNFVNQTAVSVTYIHNGSNTTTTLAADEIIISADAINTPKLLQLSGIGSIARLSSLSSPVADVPEVGANLQDHHLAIVTIKTMQSIETSN